MDPELPSVMALVPIVDPTMAGADEEGADVEEAGAAAFCPLARGYFCNSAAILPAKVAGTVSHLVSLHFWRG